MRWIWVTALLNESLSVAEVATQGGDGCFGSKASAEQPHAVQLPEPFAIADIALAPRDVFDVARVDQEDLEATGFEDFIQGDPVDAGRLHRDARHAASREPVGEPMKIGRETPEGTDRFRIALRWNCDEMLGRAAIDPSDIHVDLLQEGWRSPLLGLTTIVLHQMLLHTS